MAKYNFTYKPGTVTEDKDITLTLNTSYNGVAVNKKAVTIKVKAAAANYTVNGSTTTNSVTLDKNNRTATVAVTNGGGIA